MEGGGEAVLSSVYSGGGGHIRLMFQVDTAVKNPHGNQRGREGGKKGKG